MNRRAALLAVTTSALLSLPAEADEVCKISVEEWELSLTHMEALSGTPDLQELATLLGKRAGIRGGYRDGSRSRSIARIQLSGSPDGAGLELLAETLP